MTDITESDIEVTEEINLCMNPKIKITWTSHGRAESLKQQILQNQKDAQEYRPIKDFLKSNNFTIPQIELWLAELVQLREKITWYEKNVGIPVTERPIQLQSQHKKLVDAIQLYIDYGNLYDYQKEKLQNLLKESEKE